jgi:hypothetical protein
VELQAQPRCGLHDAALASLAVVKEVEHMKPIHIFVIPLLVMAAALAAASSATADGPFARCPEDPSVVVPGPEICTFGYSVHREFPAGTRCDFDVAIDYEVTGTIYFFENPPRAVAHMVAEGAATGNGHTLVRVARFTETASPEIVFTDHGLLGRYSLPDGGTVTVFAGYDRDSILPPEPEIFHGNFFDDNDVTAFCAALT